MAEPKSEIIQTKLSLYCYTSLNKRGGAKALVAQKSILDIVIVYLKFENNKMKPIVLRIETTGIKAEENLLRCCGDIVDSVF